MRYLFYAGCLAIPAAYLSHLAARGRPWEPLLTFILAGLAVIPLAHLMGEATEALAARVGPTWGGLLNATFGNAAELIIGVIGLSKGLNEIVKASLTGSILGNLLLVAGGAMLAGGLRREHQKFVPAAAEASGGLMLVAVAAMLVPAILHLTGMLGADPHLARHEHRLSVGVSVILLLTYAVGLLFTLRTHAHVFTRTRDPATHPCDAEEAAVAASVPRAVLTLLGAAIAVGFISELLVGAIEPVARGWGLGELFIGVILLAIIGNAAEHSSAVVLAMRDDMDTAMTIAHQSSLQIALFATPFLMLISIAMAALGIGQAHSMDLVFTPMEVVAVMLAVAIVVVLGLDGQTNWFEGALLLAVYAILALAFFYIPTPAAEGVISPAAHATP